MAKTHEKNIWEALDKFIGLFLEGLFARDPRFYISVVAVKLNDDPKNLNIKVASPVYDSGTFANLRDGLIKTLSDDPPSFLPSISRGPLTPDQAAAKVDNLQFPDAAYSVLYSRTIKKICQLALPRASNHLFYDLVPITSLDDHCYYLIFAIEKNWIARYTTIDANTQNTDNFFNLLIKQLGNYLVGRIQLKSYNIQGLAYFFEIFTIYHIAVSDYLGRIADNSEATGLYTNINAIALERYEKKDCRARIALCRQSVYKQINPVLKLRDSVSLDEHRRVRKLLETVGPTQALVSDGAEIKGVMECVHLESQPPKSVFYIDFLGYANWQITRTHGEKDFLLRYKAGKLSTISLEKKDAEISELIDRALKPTRGSCRQYLAILKAARDTKHGSILVFIKSASLEAERLKMESFLVSPFKLSPKNISSYTAMDGALLIDLKCNCHALGVILDGEAVDTADSSRGARYNSAHRYYQQYKKRHPQEKILVAVVSDDGMMDIFPGE